MAGARFLHGAATQKTNARGWSSGAFCTWTGPAFHPETHFATIVLAETFSSVVNNVVDGSGLFGGRPTTSGAQCLAGGVTHNQRGTVFGGRGEPRSVHFKMRRMRKSRACGPEKK